ncbi:TrmB family transcriptional regulator [Candidatus Woesearchaeota archaeon]|jgi:HTH-type transcriptional regulator, sugar sensing transcriptional regulator|nr:TrmB family transcriptional regulator [Candidatus Woesearchaeota archaeon]
MDLQELKKIGLTKGEIQVYEALIELGECTKTKLAQKSGISPSNIYDVTNRLLEKGIISKVEKNGVAHFSPANPNHILNFLQDKQTEIEKEKELVNSLLPSLLLKFNEKTENTNVEVFQGWNGLKTIFQNLLDECNNKDECFVFGASIGENEQQADIFFTKYSRLREQKGIQTKIIFNAKIKQRTDRINYFLKSKNYKIKFLQQSTPAEIMLYKNTACIIILTKEPLAIRITSKEVKTSFKQYFDTLWKIAEK